MEDEPLLVGSLRCSVAVSAATLDLTAKTHISHSYNNLLYMDIPVQNNIQFLPCDAYAER